MSFVKFIQVIQYDQSRPDGVDDSRWRAMCRFWEARKRLGEVVWVGGENGSWLWVYGASPF